MLTTLEDRAVPTGTPTVSIAGGSNGSESGDHAGFTVTLSEPYAADNPDAPVLVVAVSLSGQAGYQTDYYGFYTCCFNPGAASADLDFTPVDDSIVEGLETITATVGAHDPNSGTPAYEVGAGGPVSVLIADNDKASTSTALGVSWVWPEESTLPTELSMSATVTMYDPGAATLSGTVTFYGGGAALGSAAVSASGTATLNTPSPGLGEYEITAVYNGNAMCWPSTSASTIVSLTEESKTVEMELNDDGEFVSVAPAPGGFPPTSDELEWADYPAEVYDPMKHTHAAYTAATRRFQATSWTATAAIGAPDGSNALSRARFTGPVLFGSFFNAANSYVVSGNETYYLLLHERLHLRITEYVATQAAANLPPMTGLGGASSPLGGAAGAAAATVTSYNTAITILFAKLEAYAQLWVQLDNIMQEHYDDETAHANNHDSQHLWEANWMEYVDAVLTGAGWR